MRAKAKRGFIFIAALVGLVTTFIIGITFIGMAMGQLRESQRQMSSLHAIAAADAGVNYMIYKRQALSSTSDIRSGEGVDVRTLTPTGAKAPDYSFTLNGGHDKTYTWIFTVPGNTAAFQVISQGVCGEFSSDKYVRPVRTLVSAPVTPTPPVVDPNPPPGPPPPPPVFKYAFFCDEGLDIKGQSTITGPIGSNGNINIKNKATVKGDVFVATGHVVNTKGTIQNGKIVTGPPEVMPNINMEDYRAYASSNSGLVINGNWNLPAALGGSTTFTFPAGKVVFVDGDVNISSSVTLSGAGTIVATGKINFSAHLNSNLGNTSCVIIAGKGIHISAWVNISAVLYTKGEYKQTAHTVIRGAVLASTDNTFSSAHANITYVPPDGNIPIIPPPADDDDDDDNNGGGGQVGWAVMSWEQL